MSTYETLRNKTDIAILGSQIAVLQSQLVSLTKTADNLSSTINAMEEALA